MQRTDKRGNDEKRPVNIIRNFTKYAEGSVLIEVGNTRVICTVSLDDKVPPFLKGLGEGWITCEYGMLPGSTPTRKPRDSSRGKVDGRTMEIQRLIGRALRSVVDLKALGERTLWVDCDVIQADGGTRTASITGAFVALVEAVNKLNEKEPFKKYPINSFIAAISVGVVNGEKLLDLCYEEDSSAEVDMNVVMTDRGEFVEVQGTGEEKPFSKDDLNELLRLGEKGVNELIDLQKQALSGGWSRIGEVINE